MGPVFRSARMSSMSPIRLISIFHQEQERNFNNVPAKIKTQIEIKRSPGRPKLGEAADIESKLLSVALREFCKNGYGATSLLTIITLAGVAKTTLYSRFSSKEQLFRAIIEEQIRRINATALLRRNETAPLNLEEGLKFFALRSLEITLAGDILDVDRLILSESHRFPELGIAAAERSRIGIERVSNFIQECAIADGYQCKDPDGVAETFIFMLRGWYLNAVLMGGKVSVARRKRWVENAVRTLISDRSEW